MIEQLQKINRVTTTPVISRIDIIYSSEDTPKKKVFSRQRRALLSLLLGAGFFLLIAMLANIEVESKHPEWVDPPYGLRLNLLKKAVAQNSDKPLLVFIGTSRTGYGIDSKNFDQLPGVLGFNFGRSGAVLAEQLFTLKRLLKDGVEPKYVLLEILPANLGDQRTTEELIPPSRVRWKDLALVEEDHCNRSKYELHWFGEHCNILSNVRFSLLNSQLPWAVPESSVEAYRQHMPRDRFGSSPLERRYVTTQMIDRMKESTFSFYREHLKELQIQSRPIETICEILRICQERGIQSGIYLMPEARTFRGWYREDWNEEMPLRLSEICREFRIPLFDKRFSCEDADFVDGHHLWDETASEFTGSFLKDDILPWVQGLPNGQTAGRDLN